MAPTLGVLARAPAAVLLTGCLASPPSAAGDDAGPSVDAALPEVARRLGGSFHAHCAIRSGNALFCWGAGGAGQLGNGNNLDTGMPGAVIDGDDQPLTGVLGVTGSNTHGCAMMADRSVRCWGANGSGQLGNGGTLTSYRAETSVVGMTDAAAFSSFGDHTCAIDLAGAVRCWGRNDEGELGNDTVGNEDAKSAVAMLDGDGTVDDALAVSAGQYHSCVVRSDQRIWCAGLNAHGELGRHTGEAFECERPVPRAVETDDSNFLEGASLVASGVLQSCAIASGTVLCWGDPRCGQLGDGEVVDECIVPTPEPCDDEGSQPPAAVDLASIAPCTPVEVDAGENFACVLCAEGHIGCFGDATRGRLGDGNDTASSIPVRVSEIDTAVEMLVGFQSSCARLDDDRVLCWGEGSEGQLGDGRIGLEVYSATPVEVLQLPP